MTERTRGEECADHDEPRRIPPNRSRSDWVAVGLGRHQSPLPTDSEVVLYKGRQGLAKHSPLFSQWYYQDIFRTFQSLLATDHFASIDCPYYLEPSLPKQPVDPPPISGYRNPSTTYPPLAYYITPCSIYTLTASAITSTNINGKKMSPLLEHIAVNLARLETAAAADSSTYLACFLQACLLPAGPKS